MRAALRLKACPSNGFTNYEWSHESADLEVAPPFGDPYSVLSSGTPEDTVDNSPHKDSSKELREDRRVSLLYRVYRTRTVH